MKGVSESVAGRAAILQLLPFSLAETPRASVLLGGYPEVLARPASRSLWFSSYMQTYLERDVRAVTNVKDPGTFRRFIAMVASRHGQLLNRTDLAGPLGVSVLTVSDWLHVLEVTGQIILVPPYFENFGKRLIMSPKVYIGDSGFACYLLGITSQAELERSPFPGPLFEGYVAAEIIKSQINRGERKELYHFRDQQGLEVDFLFPARGGDLWMVECKAAKTIQSHMTGPLRTLREAMGTLGQKVNIKAMIVHRAAKTAAPGRAVSPGVTALDIGAFAAMIGGVSGGQNRRTAMEPSVCRESPVAFSTFTGTSGRSTRATDFTRPVKRRSDTTLARSLSISPSTLWMKVRSRSEKSIPVSWVEEQTQTGLPAKVSGRRKMRR